MTRPWIEADAELPKQNCSGCRWWSEMVAQAHGNGVEALCLNPKSRFHSKYTRERQVCAEWGVNNMGAVDAPNAGEDILDLYARQDMESEDD